jgi:small subunit ribosomal protein S18
VVVFRWADRLAQNFSLVSEFMTSFGRIRHSSDTGLRPVNQRKMAKTVRRAIGLGIHPSVHRHPEILMRQMQHISEQSRPGDTAKPKNSI